MTTTTDATIDTDALREAWTKVHGPPNAAAEELLRLNPSYFARVLDFTAHAWRRGPLPPKVKALILLAVDSAASHLNGPGAADDVRRALALGATPAEVLETLELTSTMGIHAANTGVPILLEELAAAGRPVDMEAAADRTPGGDQGRVHRQARLLERVLGRLPPPRRRVLRHLHGDVRALLGARNARAQGQGVHLLRVRLLRHAHVRPRPASTRRQRDPLRGDGGGADGGVRARERDRGGVVRAGAAGAGRGDGRRRDEHAARRDRRRRPDGWPDGRPGSRGGRSDRRLRSRRRAAGGQRDRARRLARRAGGGGRRRAAVVAGLEHHRAGDARGRRGARARAPGPSGRRPVNRLAGIDPADPRSAGGAKRGPSRRRYLGRGEGGRCRHAHDHGRRRPPTRSTGCGRSSSDSRPRSSTWATAARGTSPSC